MGCVYRRKNSLWIKFKDDRGAWKCKPSKFKVGDERKAKALLERVENLSRPAPRFKATGRSR